MKTTVPAFLIATLLPAAAAPAGVAVNPSGNVLVSVVDGNLVIRGDAGNNDIIVTESGIAGRAGTRVNGKRRASIPDGVTQDVRIELMDGDDTVRIELPGTNFSIPQDLVINTGAGNDNVQLLQVRVPLETRIVTSDGNDVIYIDGVQRFSEYYRSDFGGRFYVRTGGGDDLLEFHNTTFQGEVDVDLGGGIDGGCSTQDTEFLSPHLAVFSGGTPSMSPGDGFVSPGFEMTLTAFESFPDDCSYLGGRF